MNVAGWLTDPRPLGSRPRTAARGHWCAHETDTLSARHGRIYGAQTPSPRGPLAQRSWLQRLTLVHADGWGSPHGARRGPARSGIGVDRHAPDPRPRRLRPALLEIDQSGSLTGIARWRQHASVTAQRRLAGGEKVVGHRGEHRRVSRARDTWVAGCECGWTSGEANRTSVRDQLDAHLQAAIDAGARITGGGREPPTGTR